MLLLSRALLVLGVLFVLVVSLVADAAAHAALVRTDPPAGAVLPEAPPEIRLWFTEPLEVRFTRAQVLDAAGELVAGVSSAIAADDDHQLVVTLPPGLEDGGYTVAWRNLSAADGHTLEGYFGFQVGASAASGAMPAMAVTPGNDTVRPLTRAFALIGLAALLAIAPVTLGVLDPTARAIPGVADRLAPRLRRYALAAAGVALLGSVAALAAQAGAIAPDVGLPAAIGETLTRTRYGQLWLVRLLGLVLVTVAVVVALWGRPSWRRGALVVGALIGLGVPIPFSLISHAAAQPRGAAAAITADALHLLAASIWGGGLLLLVTVLVPALRPYAAGTAREALRVAIPRFSVLALAAWGLLLLSGLYSAWLQVGSLEALRQTPYGQSLLIKGGLIIPILVLAIWHFTLGWRGVTGAQPRRVAVTFALEALLVVAVLLVVGRLIGQEPAREVFVSQTPTMLEAPLLFAADDGTREGRLSISPGTPGINVFTIDIAGPPLPEVAEGVLRFTLPEQEMGAQELRLPAAGANRFRAEGSELALPGDWRIEVIVRQIGAFSWTTNLTLPVGATPPAVPELNPAPLFGPAAVVGMIALALGLAGLSAALVAPGPVRLTRAATTAGGAGAVAGGVMILVASLLPPPGPAVPVIAASAPLAQASPAVPVSPRASHHEDHTRGSATPVAGAGPGTPVIAYGIAVAIDTSPTSPGPTDVTVRVTLGDGTPLTGARVAVLSEMPGMAMGRGEIPTVETGPGYYVAEGVPLGMAGEWRLTVRLSPRGQPTRNFPFTVSVPR